ncbi:MAG TPA: hypothetical protein VLJ60_10265 [bacterium]|nr:hypothetical protein [bacterium]
MSVINCGCTYYGGGKAVLSWCFSPFSVIFDIIIKCNNIRSKWFSNDGDFNVSSNTGGGCGACAFGMECG